MTDRGPTTTDERPGDTPAPAADTARPEPTLTFTKAPSAAPDFGAPMVLIPAGEFKIGNDAGDSLAICLEYRSDCERSWYEDEEPIHTVNLDAFFMDVYEVTNARYAECVQAGDCDPPTNSDSYTRDSYYGDAAFSDYPVVYVTWTMAQAYCQWRGGDLPTEAQWEKAARGGLEGMDYPWGDQAPVCQKGAENGAKFDDNGVCDFTDTEPVGSYGANGYGLYDMAGNVWEWVLDWYDESFYNNSPADNPVGPSSGDYRVLRGGSCHDNPDDLRVASRGRVIPDHWNG